MGIQIKNEKDLLDQEKRKLLIAEFESTPNHQRKYEAFKAYECLKDKTVHYVLELLIKQFDSETVDDMQHAMSNLSILRKVISKLAKVYSNGVKRTMPQGDQVDAKTGETGMDPDTKAVEEMAQYLKLDTAMKKCNRYFRAMKNCLVYVRPMGRDDGKFDLKVEVLPPFHYDAVEDCNNPEEPMAIVMSDYFPTRRTLYTLGNPATAGRGIDEPRVVQEYSGGHTPASDGKTKDELDKKEYIWWTKNYHFTTNAKGEYIGELDPVTGLPGTDNPIKELPYVNFCGEQDGQFWAEGGGDLVDAGIKINTMITNIRSLAINQGYGQLWQKGKNLPKSIKVGPQHCIQMEYDTGDPVPEVGYLNSNPPIDELRALVEMDVALMLTTNNLSTSGFSTNLQGGKDFASGIALMIDKSESTEDIEEQAKTYIEKEPKVWRKLGLWYAVYSSRNLLSEEVKQIKMPKEPELVQLSFPSAKPVMGELDELNIYEKRLEMGLDTTVEILMRDDPSLTTEEAQQKADKITAEKQKKMQTAQQSMGAGGGNPAGGGATAAAGGKGAKQAGAGAEATLEEPAGSAGNASGATLD